MRETAGLAQAIRLGIAHAKSIEKHVERSISKKGRVRWCKLFKLPSATRKVPSKCLTNEVTTWRDESVIPPQTHNDLHSSKLPVKLEIAAGTGDWVVAQAQADIGAAVWTAIEVS